MTTNQKVSQPVKPKPPVMKDYTAMVDSKPLSVENARTIAHAMHSADKDKSGEPYHLHLDAVQAGVIVLGGSEEEQIAALFHDAVEDGHTTLKHLEQIGCTPATVAMVEAVSKRSHEEQNKYLARIIAQGHGACRVKVADLMHNTRHDRMAAVPEYTRDRLLKKYRPALAALMLNLGLLADEDTQHKLATKPLGSATGWSTTGSTKPFNLSIKALMFADWVEGWTAPIATLNHGNGSSTFTLANGEQRTEAWRTRAGNDRKVKAWAHTTWKTSASVKPHKDATEAQIADFIKVIDAAKNAKVSPAKPAKQATDIEDTLDGMNDWGWAKP